MIPQPVSDALNSAARLGGKMIAELAAAASAPHPDAHVQIHRAIELSRELTTRLEAARDQHAAMPIEERT